ncbi:MAG: M28 family peptidase [Pyrinomonadaceae bacterium]
MRTLYGIVLTALICVGSVPAQQTGVSNRAGARVTDLVTAVASGANTKARGAAITKRLDELGIRYRVEPFTYEGHEGNNIVAELPAPETGKELMLGAHYDRVSEGKGAVDNASGAVAVLELLAALKEKPLKNYKVSAAFFDLEEIGLRGSADYIKSRQGKNLPAVFINFDVFGYGDTLWGMARDKKSLSAASVKDAAAASKFLLEIGTGYPPSDHLSFIRAGVDTLAFSLIDGKEIKSVLMVFQRERPEVMPRVLTIIHSGNDTPDKIDGAAVARALPVIEQAIRLIDK